MNPKVIRIEIMQSTCIIEICCLFFPSICLHTALHILLLLYVVHNMTGAYTWVYTIYITAFMVRTICVGPAVGAVDRPRSEKCSYYLSRRKRGHLNCSTTCADSGCIGRGIHRSTGNSS